MKTKILALIIACLVMVSCTEEFITKDFDKTRYVPGTFYNTKDHAAQALNAAYATLNQWANGYVWDVGILHFVLGDDLYETGYAAGFTPWGPISNFDIQSNQGPIGNVWNSYYGNILVCNNAIDVIPKAQKEANDPNFTEADVNMMLGQVLFLRAFYYWNLAQYWGDDKVVIRRTPPQSEDEFVMAPAPADSTVAFIESDLKKAQTLLASGLNNTAGYEKGRVTRGAVTALLGKLYMNRGMYDKAAAEFKKILPGVGDAAYGTYTLTQNFRDNFTRTTENNTESIFEVQMNNMNSSAGWGNNDVNWLFQNWTLNRTSWDIMWWNFAVPHIKLDEYEYWTETIGGVPTTVYDYRVYSTFWGVPNGAHFTDQHGVEKDYLAQGWDDETVIGQKGVFGIRKYALDKASEAPTGLDPLWSDNNVRLIRLGDIMLLYAECMANINSSNLSPADPNSAIYWLNLIRDRANNVANDQPNLYSARTGIRGQLPTAQALMAEKGWTLMQLIEHERYVEGYCEGWRKEDLLRWKKGSDYVKFKPSWKGYQSLILPVPQTEADRNPNF